MTYDPGDESQANPLEGNEDAPRSYFWVTPLPAIHKPAIRK